MAFHHPYNFIPVTGKLNGRPTPKTEYDQIKTGQTAARHDLWLKDCYSGRVICQLHLDTPTVVGAKQEEDPPHPSKLVTPYRRDDQLAIPGNSLRGMIGSIAETLSQSSLRVLEDRFYSVRESVGWGRSAIGMLKTSLDPEEREFDLLPLTIPTLPVARGQYELPTIWKKVFKGAPLWSSLPAYVDGYEEGGAAGQPKRSYSPGSFLEREKPDSFSARSPVYYYARLVGVPNQNAIDPIASGERGLKKTSNKQPFEGHADKGYRRLLQHWPLSAQDPQQIVGGSSVPAVYFDRWASFLDLPIRDEKGYGWRLFPELWGKEARDWVAGEAEASKDGKRGWIVYADNRTFVWTCALLEKGGETLREIFNEGELRASAFGHWIKLLNMDRPGSQPRDTHQSMEFERSWAEERTYKRWEEWGTFYGFSYHSGAMIGPPLNEPHGPPLWKHFGEMYFDQMLLLLYLRISLFRFSTQLNEISSRARDQGRETTGRETWLKDFQGLRWHFALFTNLYQFPLLSNQQQGLEMYSRARQAMDVDELFEEVQKEIHSSHEYLAIQKQQEQTQITTLLTVVATLGFAFALATGFFGMDILVKDLKKWNWGKPEEWGILAVTLFICLGFLFGIVRFSNCLSRFFRWLMGKDL